MNKSAFYVGMGMGLMVGGCTMYLMRPKKPTAKRLMGRTLKTVGDVADSLSDMLGL